jgi:hypothetical protein
VTRPIPLEQSRITARLHLDYRQKGLLWYSTYAVDFRGRYAFLNNSDSRQIVFQFPLPAENAIYDDLTVQVDGRPVNVVTGKTELTVTADVAPGATAILETGYRSQGLDTWSYDFGRDVAQVRDFELRVISDFDGIDFPDGALSPTEKRPRGKGMELAWIYRNLVSGQKVRIGMPERLQPGPVAGEISFFAPVSLLFFFFVLFMLATLRGTDLHPMHYFFLAAAFFAFHLLFAYLVDHVDVRTSFVIAAAVSVFLVVSYLGRVVNARFAAVEAGLAQVVYLVLFSYAFFFEGYTGLAITIGAVLTLFVVMQATANVRWGALPARA